MPDYIEALCVCADNERDAPDIVVALLAELGFESFETIDDGTSVSVKAYIREDFYDAGTMEDFAITGSAVVKSVHVGKVAQENWNSVWESDFPMTVIAGRCVVYAPFHADVPDLPYKINILPQMAFGTGHHETTAMMAELLLDTELDGKSVMDMGCGTGILAILAKLRKASRVVAIDADEWAYRNALENCTRNGIGDITVLQGDSSLLHNMKFDAVLANINRNVLLNDIPAYATCLGGGGLLQLSGFYESDFPDVTACAEQNGYHYWRHTVKKEWVAVQYVGTTSIFTPAMACNNPKMSVN
ncbi:MAG: 50S ribosomal protein L11 methyltransferase [Bacteroidales bacterium]|jgi:ribosomal protein L11 methyltransferase|nr:50S ribosomal protein L11 methyltransferase [Bacteroidales bacterium]